MRLLSLSFIFVALFAQILHARPIERELAPQPISGPTPWIQPPASSNKAAVDTVFIMGGPNGSFDTPDGQPDWHGWTHQDATSGIDNHWHTSTYWADHIEGHGTGNFAMYCGQEGIPACSEPDTIGGYGDNYFDNLVWESTVADPSQAATIHLTGLMNYDLTDTDWDFLELFIRRDNINEKLASWTGTGDTTVNLDFTAIFNPYEFSGQQKDTVKIWWRVWSDQAYSDVDCLSPGHGACQMDDLSVYINDNLVTFDDFEPSSPVNWTTPIFEGIGDFINLRNDLGDRDRCLTNTTYQVNFVDDGVVVPGTGGTPCITYCYDPGGWIVNNDGCLLSGDTRDWFLENSIISPPLAWEVGNDAAELAFDVYVDETLHANTAGIF